MSDVARGLVVGGLARNLLGMSRNDDSDFRVRPGRGRKEGRGAVGRGPARARSFVSQVMAAASKAGGRRVTSFAGPGRRGSRKGRCSRIGRGQAVATRLKLGAEVRRSRGQRSRRVVIKARIVRMKLGSRAADAHVRYLQRDGTTRDGERGRLYGRDQEVADGGEFVERGRQDRHQFRFIVAPEDGDQLSDLRALTRDMMAQMEKDLETRLDWVAVDHFNTGHPHTHVLVRGKDDQGKDLIIAQDYITDGMRIRAQELVTLELGPESELELRRKLRSEITAERFTRIDRALLAEADHQILDLRPEAGQIASDFDRDLRLARLKRLERYGLAGEAEPGQWALAEDLEPRLRALGERGDIIKAMNRALTARGQDRPMGSYVTEAGETPVIGRVIDKRLIDELDDRMALIVDGIDGRVHHIEVGGGAAEDVKIGAIISAGPSASARPADKTIVEQSFPSGLYRPSLHRAEIIFHQPQRSGDEADALVESHVRRLEALRRAGIVQRQDADHWIIPDDFEQRAAQYEARRGRQANLRLLSAFDLDQQVGADGATWLDRRMLSRQAAALTPFGFGAEVQDASQQREAVLIEKGHAWRTQEGELRVRANLIATLERAEIARTGSEMANAMGVPFRMAHAGETIQGTFTGTADLASGKFAVMQNTLEFTLVPWRPVIERYRGQEIAAVIEPGGGVGWQLGRGRGLGLGL